MKFSGDISRLFMLSGRVILITGGYGLLGRQFAKTLANAQADVVIGGRNLKKARQVAQDTGGFAVHLDVTRKGTITEAVRNIIDKYGRIDGLVNNASFGSPADENSENFVPVEALSEEGWNQPLQTDLNGMFFCAQTVGREMVRNQGGVIVNVSSIYGMGSPDPRLYDGITNQEKERFVKSIGYCVAKGAVFNLTRYLAIYWREKKIRVNTLTLGGVYDRQADSFVREYAKRTPIGRMAESDEYNGALLFLLSDASSYMTGSNLVIDGGWSAW